MVGASGAGNTSTPSALAMSDDQSGWPPSSICLTASSSEYQGFTFKKKASDPLNKSKSASRTRLPEPRLSENAVWQARVEAPDPGFELEKTISRPRSAFDLVCGLRR